MTAQEKSMGDLANVKPLPSSRGFTVDKQHLRMLRGELTKVRCWLTGFEAGRGNSPNSLFGGIPGEDSLRQTIQYIDTLLSKDAQP